MKLRIKEILLVVFLAGIFLSAHAQKIGVKTNLLYTATTTLNAGVEFSVSPRVSLGLSAGYNPFTFSSTGMHPKIKHWQISPEVKIWSCKTFREGFIGFHAIVGEFNAGGISFIEAMKSYRYEGVAFGGGVSVGYQWAMGNRWGIETELGLGYLYTKYNKYDCGNCGDLIEENKTKNYFLPTRAAVSVIYYLK